MAPPLALVLQAAIATATGVLGLEPCPSQAEKVTQLYTQILVSPNANIMLNIILKSKSLVL